MNLEGIHNFYEALVMDCLRRSVARWPVPPDQDYLEDVACVALNQLPARYVRHTVDLLFYMTPDEQVQIELAVENAVRRAESLVARHRGTLRPHHLVERAG